MSGNFIEEERTDLFNAEILECLSKSDVDGFIVRPLRISDYDAGFIQLLGQLTDVGSISKECFSRTFQRMKKSGDYYVIVIEDLQNAKVVASATLVIEQKFIHSCALRGRVEDVVVNNTVRGKRLGKLIVTIIIQLARCLHCYKLSLDCKDHLIPFYESLGFQREQNNANCLNIRFVYENNAEQSHLLREENQVS